MNRVVQVMRYGHVKTGDAGKPQNFTVILEMQTEKLRVDKYLWSIRLFKTRSQAADACDKGKVKMKGQSVKASRNVAVTDEYEVKTESRKWVIRVTALLHNRVAFAEAVKYYEDITPAEELDRIRFQAAAFHTGKRLSKIGRPTKRQKRDLDDFLGNTSE